MRVGIAEPWMVRKVEHMKKFLAATAAVFLASSVVTASPAQAAESTRITVSGTGQVSVKRDQATSTFTVSAMESTAKAAMATGTRNFNAVRAAVLTAGAKEDDLTTTGLSLYPEYQYNSDGRPATLIGYRASISLSVTTPVSLAATIVDTAVETGGDTVAVNGISFDTANADASTATARTRAVEAAKAKATAYARAFGMRVGRPLRILETSAPIPSPIYASADKVSAAGIALDPGTAKVTVSVQVIFALLPMKS